MKVDGRRDSMALESERKWRAVRDEISDGSVRILIITFVATDVPRSRTAWKAVYSASLLRGTKSRDCSLVLLF